MTYRLEMERGVRGQITVATVKGAGVTYPLEVEREVKTSSDHSGTVKRAGTTYMLEVEGEGRRSDQGCDCKGGRDNVRTGGGEGGQEVRSWLQL
jgi:hypothetical protein